MRVDLFDFDLPEHAIGLRPASPRDHARQLIIRPDDPVDKFVDSHVYDLGDFLKPGDLLVFNDTRVIPSRLFGQVGDARVEITLHRRIDASGWWAFLKNARRAKPGKLIVIDSPDDAHPPLTAQVIDKLDDGQVRLDFILPQGVQMEEALARAGQMPLPPYIASKRPVDERDLQDYQTVYARQDGAVAAPTAGLHFTPDLLKKLADQGVDQMYVTLHVGAGTFLPVKAEDTDAHQMHAEWGQITQENANKINETRGKGGRVIAVGTTSLRLIESAARPDGTVAPFSQETRIFITPGYQFRAVDMLMTNFHLPKSTLFMLVSAFAGIDTMKNAYKIAIDRGYRFYSYGDSSLIYRRGLSGRKNDE